MLIDKLINKLNETKLIPNVAKEKIKKKLLEMKDQKINIMIIGGTGVGKSSTINALFNGEVAKVGINPAPETMEITKFKIDNNITIWDSPGLGDGIRDKDHKEKIIELLQKTNKKGENFIDCVLVLVSASNKDLGTEYTLINKVLIPNLGDNPQERIIVAINKADEAIASRFWSRETNEPSSDQQKFLEGKVVDIQNRIYESTGIDIKPMYYNAGYSDENIKDPSYKIDELMIHILEHIPPKKAAVAEESFEKENKNKDVIDKTIDLVGDVVEGIFTGAANLIKGFFSIFGF